MKNTCKYYLDADEGNGSECFDTECGEISFISDREWNFCAHCGKKISYTDKPKPNTHTAEITN